MQIQGSHKASTILKKLEDILVNIINHARICKWPNGQKLATLDIDPNLGSIDFFFKQGCQVFQCTWVGDRDLEHINSKLHRLLHKNYHVCMTPAFSANLLSSSLHWSEGQGYSAGAEYALGLIPTSWIKNHQTEHLQFSAVVMVLHALVPQCNTWNAWEVSTYFLNLTANSISH